VLVKAVFAGLCPNCGGEISDDRLAAKLPCEKCLPEVPTDIERLIEEDFFSFIKEVVGLLRKHGTLKKYKDFYSLERKVHEADTLFFKATGNHLWSAQKTWLRRVLQGKSFAILAPTGVGKTAFGTFTAVYLALKGGKRSYIILPTSVLVKQVYERALEYAEKLGLDKSNIIAYLGRMRAKDKNEFLERLRNGDFKILISTAQFLRRNFDVIASSRFDFIFVDDVDAVLRSSKNIDQILMLLGLPKESIADALRLIITKRRMAAYILRRRQIPPEIIKERVELEKRLSKALKKSKVGCLVVSTATGRPRGLRVRLFRELLGFEVGSRTEILRNVVDTYAYAEDSIEREVIRLVKRLGKGGLVFVPVSKGVEYAEKLVELLQREGVKAALVHAREKKAIEAFENGELDVLVGVAVYYGVLVRGLDLPHVVRYAVFTGVPHFRFTLVLDEAGPFRLIQLAYSIRPALDEKTQREMDRILARLRRIAYELDASSVQVLSNALKEGQELSGYLEYLRQQLISLRDMLKNLLKREDVIKNLREKTLLIIRHDGDRSYLLLPDAMTYLQASGRTSRMYAGGLSKGLSIVIVDDKDLFSNLVKQTKWYSDEIEWVEFSALNLEELLNKIDEERKFILKLKRGEIVYSEAKDLVKTALVIVESPTKARTIASFFGKPSRRAYGPLQVYEVSTGKYVLLVVASKGHIVDLTTVGGFYGVQMLDGKFLPVYKPVKRCLRCNEQFIDDIEGKCPVCKSEDIVSQEDVIRTLQKLAGEVDLVFLATDPDTEGEKIAWDIYNAVSPYVPVLRRIEFHEVTRRAIENAMREPRDIDLRLVDAQIVRRIEDRWIGFSLSKRLWGEFGFKFLSAGRVQTPVLGWIIQRYEEAKKGYRLIFRVELDTGHYLIFELKGPLEVKPREIAKEIESKGVEIQYLDEETLEAQPPPPFSTDTMLREAVRALGVGVDEVMRLAQELFEVGLITYHRTDSTRVSDAGLRVAREYITDKFGAENFRARTWGVGGAHECIRPTRPIDVDTLMELIRQGIFVPTRPLSPRHLRLYDILFRRFMASQMPPALIVKVKVRAKAPYVEREFEWYKEVKEPGFTAVYRPFGIGEPPPPGLHQVTNLSYKRLPLVPLYSQADIIKLMKEKGIGRPSTYAKILQTLIKRKYVLESGEKLVPTKLGKKVYAYLEQRFKDLVSEDRTRMVEEKMDMIERGELDYMEVLKDFYDEIMEKVEKVQAEGGGVP